MKRWRLAANLHQTAAAELAEVSQSTISASEGGTFSAGLLFRLIGIYKPSPEDVALVMTSGADAEMVEPAAEAP